MNPVSGRDAFAEALRLDNLLPAQHLELGHLLVKCKAQIEDDFPDLRADSFSFSSIILTTSNKFIFRFSLFYR